MFAGLSLAHLQLGFLFYLGDKLLKDAQMNELRTYKKGHTIWKRRNLNGLPHTQILVYNTYENKVYSLCIYYMQTSVNM